MQSTTFLDLTWGESFDRCSSRPACNGAFSGPWFRKSLHSRCRTAHFLTPNLLPCVGDMCCYSTTGNANILAYTNVLL